jgi:hypothetical protein
MVVDDGLAIIPGVMFADGGVIGASLYGIYLFHPVSLLGLYTG